MIEIDNVTKRFGRTTAVDSLSLSISKGEIFCFLGPNGAGKTTTIKMLTGLLKPTSGSVSIDGHDIQLEHVLVKKVVSYIPDFPYVYEKLTGREFLSFIAKMYDVEASKVNDKIDGFLEMFSLDAWADHMLESYSHGMRQKIVVSAALIHEPKVIIVDEPMVGLDPRGIRQVKDLFKEQANKGTSVFMSTHTLSVAQELADRIGIIHKGKLTCVGTYAEILNEHSQAKDLEEIFLQMEEE